jgi:hypothetical protein
MKTRCACLLITLLVTIAGCKAKWKTFTSTDGKFSVFLPGKPREQEFEMSSGAGPVVTTMYSVECSNGAYLVCFRDLPFCLEKPCEIETLLKLRHFSIAREMERFKTSRAN